MLQKNGWNWVALLLDFNTILHLECKFCLVDFFYWHNLGGTMMFRPSFFEPFPFLNMACSKKRNSRPVARAEAWLFSFSFTSHIKYFNMLHWYVMFSLQARQIRAHQFTVNLTKHGIHKQRPYPLTAMRAESHLENQQHWAVKSLICRKLKEVSTPGLNKCLSYFVLGISSEKTWGKCCYTLGS